MLQAQIGADSRAARARHCWDHDLQEFRRSRGDPRPLREVEISRQPLDVCKHLTTKPILSDIH